MKSKKPQKPAADSSAELLQKRAPDSGPAGDDRPGESRETIASQTKTTRRLDQAVKREADNRMAGRKKAVERWEGEGGAIPPAKKGGKK